MVRCGVKRNMHGMNTKVGYPVFEFSSCFDMLRVWVRMQTAIIKEDIQVSQKKGNL
jgi:hypothetical protein